MNKQLNFPQRNWLLLCVIFFIAGIVVQRYLLTPGDTRMLAPGSSSAVSDSSQSTGIPPDSLSH